MKIKEWLVNSKRNNNAVIFTLSEDGLYIKLLFCDRKISTYLYDGNSLSDATFIGEATARKLPFIGWVVWAHPVHYTANKKVVKILTLRAIKEVEQRCNEKTTEFLRRMKSYEKP